MKDELGNRMRSHYESRTRQYLPRRTYTIIRLDGKCFGNFTKGMDRPFDDTFLRAMDYTTKRLCENIQGVKFGYTQSDEISLLLTDFATITTDAWFDGNIQKIASVSASMATGYFNEYFRDLVKEKGPAFFDARVFTIPDPVEVENYFIWRQKDAVRNSLSMLAQSLYSHKELNEKSQVEMHNMIYEKGENWNDLPDGVKRGRVYSKYGPTHSEWGQSFPDFLKQRFLFEDLIPKINES